VSSEILRFFHKKIEKSYSLENTLENTFEILKLL